MAFQKRQVVQNPFSNEFNSSMYAASMPKYRVAIPVRVDEYNPIDSINGIPVRQSKVIMVSEGVLNDPNAGPIHEMIRQQRRFP